MVAIGHCRERTADAQKTATVRSASARLSVGLLKDATLQVYENFPHGMCTTHADVVNPALLKFVTQSHARYAA